MLKIINRLFLLYLCCFFSLIVNATIKNNPDTPTKSDITEWQLIDITYLPNKLHEPEVFEQLIEKSKNISLKSSNNKLIIDENNAIDIHQTKDTLPPQVNKLLQKVLERLNLTNKQIEYKYFTFEKLPKQYNLNKSIVLISDYLFLFTDDEIVLAFKIKQKMRQELAGIYNKLNTTNVPLNNRYWSDEEENNVFSAIHDEFNYFFKGMIDDGSLKILKLKSYKNIKLLLLYSCAINSSNSLSLISLSNNFDVIDRLEIGEVYELEDGGILVEYAIDKNYLITLNKVEHRDNKSPKLLSKNYYKINDQGKFVKVKK